MLNVTKQESSQQNNVINTADDVDMSSTQLSKSIDKHLNDNDDDSPLPQRRSMLTSGLLAFPCCCQSGINANEILTFPLGLEKNPLISHYENISLHDLLRNLKERQRGDGAMANYKLRLPSMAQGDVRRGRVINTRRHQYIYDSDEWNFNWSPNYNLRGQFPVKLQQLNKLYTNFPCRVGGMPKAVEKEDGQGSNRKSFPFIAKLKENKLFPCCHEKSKYEEKGYVGVSDKVEGLKLTNTNMKNALVYVRNLKGKSLENERCLSIFKKLKELNLISKQWLRFPVKPFKDNAKQFPCLILQQESFSEKGTESSTDAVKLELNTNLQEIECSCTDAAETEADDKIQKEIKLKSKEGESSTDAVKLELNTNLQEIECSRTDSAETEADDKIQKDIKLKSKEGETSSADSTTSGTKKLQTEIDTNLQEFENVGKEPESPNSQLEIKTNLKDIDSSTYKSEADKLQPEIATIRKIMNRSSDKAAYEIKTSENQNVCLKPDNFNGKNFKQEIGTNTTKSQLQRFPFNTKISKTKFPFIYKNTEIMLNNLSVGEIRQIFFSNKINKSLQTPQNSNESKSFIRRQFQEITFRKFPLLNLNNNLLYTSPIKEIMLKFPLMITDLKLASGIPNQTEYNVKLKNLKLIENNFDLITQKQTEVYHYSDSTEVKPTDVKPPEVNPTEVKPSELTQPEFKDCFKKSAQDHCLNQSKFNRLPNDIIYPRFPINNPINARKFPWKSFRQTEIMLNLSVHEVRLRYEFSKISKSIKPIQKPGNHKNSITEDKGNLTFPLKFNKINRDNVNMFPVNSSEILTYVVTPMAISKFPVQVDQNPRKFPYVNYTGKFLSILSIAEWRKHFDNQRISNAINQHPLHQTAIFKTAPSIKTLTKFPLKTRMFKKFYRIFPSEMDIPAPQHVSRIPIRLQGSHKQHNGQHLGLRNLKTIPLNNLEVSKPQTPPDLNKQQQNTTDVNENQVAQVQILSQVHVENSVKISTLRPPPPPPSTYTLLSGKVNNNRGHDINILPAINTKNIPLTTTKTAAFTAVQHSENFEHHNAIINIREDVKDVKDVVVSSLSLSENIINSLHNNQLYNEEVEVDDCGRDAAARLRASTPPPMSTSNAAASLTSVQNAESNVVVHKDLDGHDLCNPQVAQIVERSSDVRDTFDTTVVEDGGQIKENRSSTGSILASSSQGESSSSSTPATSSPPNALTSTQTSSPLPPTSSVTITPANVASDATSPQDNYPFCIELLPKYSVVELGASNATNCPEIDCTKITGVNAESFLQNADGVSNEISNKLEKVNELVRRKSNENIQNCENIENCELRENFKDCANFEYYPPAIVALEEINETDDDSRILDEMKFEMKSSKGALPSTTTSASSRTSVKPVELTSSYNSALPNTSSVSLRADKDRLSSAPASSLTRPTTTATGTATRRLSSDVSPNTASPSLSSSLRSSADRNALTPATRRLSNDYSSGSALGSTYSSTPRTSAVNSASSITSRTPYQRSSTSYNFNNESNKIPSLSANRYATDTTTAAIAAPTTSSRPKLSYMRSPTSASLLSVDLTGYTPSTDSLSNTSVPMGRTASLDTSSSLDILPERTRLRRQRRFRPQDSQDEDEDPIQRLNRLKARISASLSEVKGVLKQYSTEGEGEAEQQSIKPSATASSSVLPLRKVDEENDEQNQEEGPVTFRFVKKVRRRSFYSEDDDDKEGNANEKGTDEVDRSLGSGSRETSTLQVPQQQNESAKDSSQRDDAKNLDWQEKSSNILPTTPMEVKPAIRVEDYEQLENHENQKYHRTDLNHHQQQISGDVPPDRKAQVAAQQQETDSEKSVEANKHDSGNVIQTKSDIKSKETDMKILSQSEEGSVKVSDEQPLKKGQTLKASKANKNEVKQRNTKVGKAPSKIPQKIETKSVTKREETENKYHSVEFKEDPTKPENRDKVNDSRVTNDVKTKEISSLEREVKEHSDVRGTVSPKDTSSKSPIMSNVETKIVGNGNNATNQTSPQVSKSNATTNLASKKSEINNNNNVKEVSPHPKDNDVVSVNHMNENDTISRGMENLNKDIKMQIQHKENLATKTEHNQSMLNDKIETIQRGEVNATASDNYQTKKGTSNHQSEVLPSTEVSSLKPLIKIEGVALQTSAIVLADNKQVPQSNQTQRSENVDNFNETPPKIKKRLITKPKDPSRRASLAAVEGSKIEPPVHMATPGAIQRRPSDSEAIVKKKPITTKITTSGSIGEVTPKPKIVKVKRVSIKKPPSPPAVSDDHDTRRHQLAITQQQQPKTPLTITTNNRNDQRHEEAASPSSEANKSFQGDRDKDVTMPTDEMLTQLAPAPSSDGSLPLNDRIDRTQLVIDKAAKCHPPSSSSLTKKTIGNNDSSSSLLRATTTNLAAIKFENSAGDVMLANVKPTLISSTPTSEAIAANKQTPKIPPCEDLHDLLQQEAVIIISKPNVAKNHNELKADERNTGTTHAASILKSTTLAKLEATSENSNEPLEILQQQVVRATDITNDLATPLVKATATVAPATSALSSSSTVHTSSSSVTTNQQQQQQQQPTAPTTTTTTTTTSEDDATTKTNDAPQISISNQEVTTKDTTKAATLPSSLPIPESTSANTDSTSKGLADNLAVDNMPELQLAPAPVQTADIPHDHDHEPHKRKVVIKKIIRPNSTAKTQKAEVKAQSNAELPTELVADAKPAEIIEEVLQDDTVPVSANEEYSESTEQSAEGSSSQSEAEAAAAKPQKIRTVKKKVIIKCQKRRLSVSDPFFNHVATEEPVNTEVETQEKAISYVTDDEETDEEPAEEPVVEEKKPLKSCIHKKEYQIGDEVLFAERFKKTQIRWKRGRVKERITSISYLIDIDGKDVSSHINYLKKYTGRKVNFGGKEYLEIDYEQLEEDEERAEKVKQRSSSIWNMV